MLFELPQEIKTKIFEYDASGREFFLHTLHHLKMAPGLQIIKTLDYKTYFKGRRGLKNWGIKIDLDFHRSYWWNKFREDRLKKN